jgi:putative transport protein
MNLPIANTFFELFKPESVSLTVLTISVVATIGIALGALRIRGVGLGIGGVLFSGLGLGWFFKNHELNPQVMEFGRDFGLILFIYMIGVQVGPGFFASLRHNGLRLNLVAAAVVLAGVGVTVLIAKVGGVPMADAVGLLAGGTTNTPSLASAAQVLREAKGVDASATVAGYAIAYPFGIVGIILTMVALRAVFRVDVVDEARAWAAAQPSNPPLATMSLEVANRNLDGREIRRIPGLVHDHVVISRVMQSGTVRVARPKTVLHVGDVLLAVGPREGLEDLKVVVGSECATDPRGTSGPITTRRILVTRRSALRRTPDELDLAGRLGVSVTRVRRGEVELSASGNVPLQFGDVLTVVGEADAIVHAAHELGDSVKRLNSPQLLPVFIGIALGVILGSLPVHLPGVPAPVKLGLAGGPLVVALVLSRLGQFGPLIWYLPLSANLAVREVGITLFLACVGLKSGGEFFHTLAAGPGLYYLGCGALITAVPLLLVGALARIAFGLNYLTLCGLLAGSMTDPPALSFASAVTDSDAPSVAYAAVYPLAMLLRVIAAQVLVLAFV